MSHLHTLNIDFTPVKDVSMLGKLHTLSLIGSKVEDVSVLGNLHTVKTGSDALFIKGIANLSNLHTLQADQKDLSQEIVDKLRVHTLMFRLVDFKKVKIPKGIVLAISVGYLDGKQYISSYIKN